MASGEVFSHRDSVLTILIGDSVFSPAGKPGVVTKRDDISGQLVVETNTERFEKRRHRGFVNGLASAERETYNQVMDQVKKESSPEKRVKILTEEIGLLRAHPKNRVVANYLEGEKAHIMHTEGIHPRSYKIDAKSTRS